MGFWFWQTLSLGAHRIIGPPSAAGTGWLLAAMKEPTIPTVRIAIRIASFAFIFACIVLLLLDLGFACSARPSQVTLVMQAAFQSRYIGLQRAYLGVSPENKGVQQVIGPCLPTTHPGRGSRTQTKALVV